MSAQVIDDGESGFTPFNNTISTNYGYGYSYDSTASETPGDYAEWTFNVTPGAHYRVSASWPANAASSSYYYGYATPDDDVKWAVYGSGSTPLVQGSDLDQTVDRSGSWEELASNVTATGSTMRVRFLVENDGYVTADAIRIEELVTGPEVSVSQGSISLSDGGTFDFGTALRGVSVSKTFTVSNTGTTDLTVQPVTAPAGFTVTDNFTTDEIIEPGQSATFTVRMDATEPGELSGGLSFESDDANESPFNIALTGTVTSSVTIDDGDGGFAAFSSPIYLYSSYSGFGSDATGSQSPGDYAEWTFNVVPGAHYRVSATWPGGSSSYYYTPDDDVKWFIYGAGATALAQGTNLDQTVDHSGNWEELAADVTATGSTLRVRFLVENDGFVTADAIKIEEIEAPNAPEIAVLQNSSAIADGGTFSFGTTSAWTAVSKTFTVQNTGTEILVLQPITLSGSGDFSITSNFAAGQELQPGASATFTVRLNGNVYDLQSATILISSNDADEGSFEIAVSGTTEEPENASVSPIVNTGTGSVVVVENAASGVTVGITAFATDPNPNGTGIVYSLPIDAGGRFTIDSSTGVITVANGSLINRESAEFYDVVVSASSSVGSLSSFQSFRILVTDVNEFAVGAISNVEVGVPSIEEGSPDGALVGLTALASDDDASGNSIVYQLTNSAGGRFAIDSLTGIVTVADGSLLDFDSATSHIIEVKAVGSDGSFSLQTFTIAVTQASASAASGSLLSLHSIVAAPFLEGTPISARVKVADIRIATESQEDFELALSGDDAALFEVDGSVLYLKANSLLDFETNPQLNVSVTLRDAATDEELEVKSLSFDVADRLLVAVEDAVTVTNNGRGNQSTLAVLSNDFTDSGQPLQIIGVTGALHGTVTITAGGGGSVLTYVADAGFLGTETLTYTVQDANGNQFSTKAVVRVNRAADYNQAPEAQTLSRSTNAGRTLTFDPLAMAVDADSDGITLTSVSAPQHGTLQDSTNLIGHHQLVYTPAAGFAGTETLTYTIEDEFGNVSTGSIVIQVGNSASQATNEQYQVTVGDTLSAMSTDGSGVAPSVLVNDLDADLQDLSAVLVDGPAHGTLIFNSDGTFVYEPDSGYIGTDSFTYRANDGVSNTDVATVSINVTSQQVTPGLVPQSYGPAPATGENHTGITTISGYSVDPTAAFEDAPTASGQTSQTVSIDQDDSETVNGVDVDSNVFGARTTSITSYVDENGNWWYNETIVQTTTTTLVESDGALTTVMTTYAYSFSANGNDTYSSFTEITTMDVQSFGSFSGSWNENGTSGSSAYSWMQTNSSSITVTNTTNFVTGVSFGSYVEITSSMMSYTGTGSYSATVTGGSASGSIIESGGGSTSHMLQSSYVLSPTGWTRLGNGFDSSTSFATSNSTGNGSYSISDSANGVTRSGSGTMSSSSSATKSSTFSQSKLLGPSGWQITGGGGMASSNGNSTNSHTTSGSYSRSIDGGTISGSFSSTNGGGSNYNAIITATYSGSGWVYSGMASSGGNFSDQRQSGGGGTYSRSSSSTGEDGSTTSTTTFGNSTEQSNDFSSGSHSSSFQYSGGGWIQTSGGGNASGGGSSTSSYSEGGTYTRTFAGGSANGFRSGSGGSTSTGQFSGSSTFSDGEWVNTGSATQTGSDNSSYSSVGNGTFTSTENFDDGTSINMKGTLNESVTSSSNSTSSSGSSFVGEEWVQTTGQGTSISTNTSTTNSTAAGSYTRQLEGGSSKGTGTTTTQNTTTSTSTVNATFANGAWTNTGTSQDSSNGTDTSNYVGTGSTQKTTKFEGGGSQTVNSKVNENGGESTTETSNSTSTLLANGTWQLSSGTGTETTTGISQSDVNGTGTFSRPISNGSMSGSITEQSNNNRNFTITMSSSVDSGTHAWATTGTREDSSTSGSSSSSNGTSFYMSASSTEEGSSITVGGGTQTTSSSGNSSSSSKSSWGADSTAWTLLSGTGGSSSNSSSSYNSSGFGLYTQKIDGGFVMGTTSESFNSGASSTSSTTSSVVDGIWVATGTASSDSNSTSTSNQGGTGTYSKTENGTTVSGSATHQANSSDTSESKSSSSLGSNEWTQTSGSSKSTSDASGSVTYITNVQDINTADGLSGTATESTEVGSSANSKTESAFADGKWTTTGSGEAKSWVGDKVSFQASGSSSIGSGVTTTVVDGSETVSEGTKQKVTLNGDGHWVAGQSTDTYSVTSQYNETIDTTQMYSHDMPGGGGAVNGVRSSNATYSVSLSLDIDYSRNPNGSQTATGTATFNETRTNSSEFTGSGQVTHSGADSAYSRTVTEQGSSGSNSTLEVSYTLSQTTGKFSISNGTYTSSGTSDSSSTDDTTSSSNSTTTSTGEGQILLGSFINVEQGVPLVDQVKSQGFWADYEATSTSTSSLTETHSVGTNSSYSTNATWANGHWDASGTGSSGGTSNDQIDSTSGGTSDATYSWDHSSGSASDYGSITLSSSESTTSHFTSALSSTGTYSFGDAGWEVSSIQDTATVIASGDYFSGFNTSGSGGQESSSTNPDGSIGETSRTVSGFGGGSTTEHFDSHFERDITTTFASGEEAASGTATWGTNSNGLMTGTRGLQIDGSSYWSNAEGAFSNSGFGLIYTGEDNADYTFEGEWSLSPETGQISGAGNYDGSASTLTDWTYDTWWENNEDSGSDTYSGGIDYQDSHSGATPSGTSSGLSGVAGWDPSTLGNSGIASESGGFGGGPSAPPQLDFTLGIDAPAPAEAPPPSSFPGDDYDNPYMAALVAGLHGLFVTGPKAIINTAYNKTIGLIPGAEGNLIDVDPISDLGYDGAAEAAGIAFDTGLMAASSGLSCATKLGMAAQALERVEGAVDVGEGLADMVENGVSLGNVGQVALGAFELFSPGGCFPAGTLVSTETGSRPIETLEIGDRVWGFSLSSGEWRLRPIIATHKLVGEQFVELEIGGEKLVATGNHPFWVIRGKNLGTRPATSELDYMPSDTLLPGRWVDAAHLLVGDVLYLRSGLESVLERHTVFVESQPVYNFTVEDIHTYAIGHAEVLVHNTDCPRYNGRKPAYTVNPAHRPGSLRAGKTVLPDDAADVFRRAVPDSPTAPRNWFGKNAAGQIYRFSVDNNNLAHFSGIDGIGDGIRNITRYARLRLSRL